MRFWEIFRFEIGYQLRRPSTWIYFLTLTGVLLLMIAELADDARADVHAVLNAPLMMAEIFGYANKFGLFLIAVLAGDGVMRDTQSRMDALVFTTSVNKATYLGGRFMGTFCLAVLLINLAVPLSFIIAQTTFGSDPVLLGQFEALSYVNPVLFISVPDVFTANLILYGIVLLSRQAMAAFVGAIVLFVLSTFTMELSAGHWGLAKLLDPSGMTVLNAFTNSLSPVQKTTASIQLTGSLLANRMLWIVLSSMIGAWGFAKFKLAHHLSTSKRRKSVAAPDAPVTSDNDPVNTATTGDYHNGGKVHAAHAKVLVRKSSDFKTQIVQIRILAFRYCAEILFSPVGLLIPIIAIYTVILIPNMALGPMGVPIVLTTDRILLYLNNAAVEIFIALLISLVAGRLIWRERDARIHEIADAVPVSDFVLIVSKYLALALILLTLAFTLIIAGITIQLSSGYHEHDIWLFLRMISGAQLVDFLTFAAVAVVIHVTVNQKYTGHLAVMCFYLYYVLGRIVTEHKLLIFGADLGLSRSIFYNQSAFIFSWILFKFYWLGWALLLFLIAKSMWVRGRETGLTWRLRNAGRDLKRSIVLPVSLMIIMIAGGFIFYNSYILNDYISTGERISQRVDYERKYARYKGIPQPHLTATRLNIELYPDRMAAVVKGVYQLKNSTRTVIHSIHLVTSQVVDTDNLSFNRSGRFTLTDNKLEYRIYTLDQGLQPDDTLTLEFIVSLNPAGFSNSGIRTEMMNNGSYFANLEWFPSIGYQEERELTNEGDRKDHGLGKREEYSSNRDTAVLMSRSGLEKIDFEATIGTTPDQIALAPGTLTKTWSKNGRKYFHYQTDASIRNAYHIYSADYSLRKFRWKNVDLQIFHHPKSVLNLKGIEESMKASLDYYSNHFSPYPYKDLRFVEYADPGTGGISLPTSIGYSTNYALLNSARDQRGFDLAFAVAAHEIAHQWWAHQLIPARVPGKALITESLAWYSAFGVIEHTHGATHLRALLDAMRADYLDPRARAGTSLLEATESFQGYRKGPFAMYALSEYIGTEMVNTALRSLLQKFKSGEPPYATSLDFYAEIRAVTPDSLQYLLKDLFETNTFWDLKTKKVTAEQIKNGSWLVRMDVLAKKAVVDKTGIEMEQSMNDLIEIGVFSPDKENQKTLYLEKHRIHSGLNRIVVNVSQKPGEAGIDPRFLLVDTKMEDNILRVSEH